MPESINDGTTSTSISRNQCQPALNRVGDFNRSLFRNDPHLEMPRGAQLRRTLLVGPTPWQEGDNSARPTLVHTLGESRGWSVWQIFAGKPYRLSNLNVTDQIEEQLSHRQTVRFRIRQRLLKIEHTCQPSRSRRDSPDLEIKTRRPARRPKKADFSKLSTQNRFLFPIVFSIALINFNLTTFRCLLSCSFKSNRSYQKMLPPGCQVVTFFEACVVSLSSSFTPICEIVDQRTSLVRP